MLNRLVYFSLATITIILWSFVVSCNAAKQLQKKNDAAVARVNADDQLQAKVVSKWMDAHPPIEGKPQVTYLPGKDVLVPVTIPDYAYKNKVRDSLAKVFADSIDCGKAASDGYDLGYEEAKKEARKNPYIRVDTLREKIPDLREANRWRDSSLYWRIFAGVQAGQLMERSVTVSDLNKKIKSKDWTIWILIAVGILSHIARSYIPSLKIFKR